jgi:hypothetical protein
VTRSQRYYKNLKSPLAVCLWPTPLLYWDEGNHCYCDRGSLRTKELQQILEDRTNKIPQKAKISLKKAEETRNIKARVQRIICCFLHNMLLLHRNMRTELSRNWVIQLGKSKWCKMAWRVNHWWITKWDSLQSELKSTDDIFCAWYHFACRFVWVWNLVAYVEGGA